MEIKLYKIYNPTTGKYSKGGAPIPYEDTRYFWSKKGKTWNELRHVKLHLNLQYREKYDFDKKKNIIIDYSPLLKQYIRDHCVIMEYTNDGINELPIQNYIKDIEFI